MIRGRIHTDLALEAKERYEEDNVEIRGVCIEEEYNEEKDIRTTLVKLKPKMEHGRWGGRREVI